VSVGGDGTANEILCGFIDHQGVNRFPQAELVLMGSGTGGDFCRFARRAAGDSSLSVAPRAIDYGVADVSLSGARARVPFLNAASVGISGLVDRFIAGSKKRFGTRAAYVGASLRGLAEFREQAVRIVVDERTTEIPLTLAVMANGQYFGGGMWIAPGAVCDDGFLDVIHAGGLGKAALVGLLVRVFSGKHVGPGVTNGRASRVSIEPLSPDPSNTPESAPAIPLLVDLDGEQIGQLPATFWVVPRGIRVQVLA
jgi:diacylglycerol kinase family enzyme